MFDFGFSLNAHFIIFQRNVLDILLFLISELYVCPGQLLYLDFL